MRRILVTRTDRLGDVILTAPVLEHIKKTVPDCFLGFMVRPETAGAVRYDPNVDELIIYDKLGKQKGFWSSVWFSRTLRRFRFDTALVMHPTNRAHLLVFLAGIPNRIGYNRKFQGVLTKKVEHFKQCGSKHEIDYNFEMLSKAGFDVKDHPARPRVYTSEREERTIDSILEKEGVADGFFVFHPGASCPSKRWPAKHFRALAGIFNKLYKRDIVIVGQDVFSEQTAEILKRSFPESVKDLTYRLSVEELAEILKRCALFVSNDSGPVHLASAAGVPVISIFGRKDPGLSPDRWRPVGSKSRYIHEDAGCTKCKAHECEKGFLCLNKVSAEKVADIASQLI